MEPRYQFKRRNPDEPSGGRAVEAEAGEVSEPEPQDLVDEWGYESFPASDPPQH